MKARLNAVILVLALAQSTISPILLHAMATAPTMPSHHQHGAPAGHSCCPPAHKISAARCAQAGNCPAPDRHNNNEGCCCVSGNGSSPYLPIGRVKQLALPVSHGPVKAVADAPSSLPPPVQLLPLDNSPPVLVLRN